MTTDAAIAEPYTPRSGVGPHRVAEYLALPDDTRYEIINGRVFVAPSPNTRHQVIIGTLYEQFGRIARTGRHHAILSPIDVVLSDHTVVQPDVVYIRSEHKAIIKDYIDGAPDLVVEVLSPGTARRDRSEKLRLYAEVGIREYWIVDPAAEQIDFLINENGSFRVAFGMDDRYQSPAFSEVRLDVARFWKDVALRMP